MLNMPCPGCAVGETNLILMPTKYSLGPQLAFENIEFRC